MKPVFKTIITSTVLIATLTSCSNEDESPMPQKIDAPESSKETTSAENNQSSLKRDPTPPAWKPIPFDSKSGKAQINDFSSFMGSLREATKKSEKGEFETTADYKKRTTDIDAVLAPIKGSEVYILSSDAQHFQYNADKQEFKMLFAPLCLDGNRFDGAGISCGLQTIGASNTNSSEHESSILKNIGTDYYVIFPAAKMKKYLRKYTYHLPDTCPVSLQKAKEVSGLIRIGYGIRISKAELARGDSRYEDRDYSLPYLEYYESIGIFAEPEFFVCYNYTNGDVLYQKKM